MTVQMDPNWLQAAFIFILTFVALVLIWNNRQKLASVNTPYIDSLIGRAIYWLVGLVIVTTIVTAVLAVFGVTSTIRAISAENLAYLAGAYALVRWAQKQ